jgi:hypothetical protein
MFHLIQYFIIFQEPIVDLISGEASSLISWIKFLLYDKLEKYAPKGMLIKRIDYELTTRVVHPYLTHFWHWEGFNGSQVNNWNIWINSNLLQTSLLALDDAKLRNDMLTKIIKSADFFINGYPNDGGCDEGPSYWGQAGGRLVGFIDLLNSASNGLISFSNNTLMHSIGKYIYAMHIDGNKFVNFADAAPFQIPKPAQIFKYGKIYSDQTLKDFAAYFMEMAEKSSGVGLGQIGNMPQFIMDLLEHPQIVKATPKAPLLKEAFLPDLQVR